MKQNSLSVFAVVCAINMLLPLGTMATGIFIPSPFGYLHWGTKGVAAGVAHTATKAVAVKSGAAAGVGTAAVVPVLGAKAVGAKTLLLAPIAVPLALGGKALLAAKLAIPMGVGAAIGAPVGALIGAKAGAIKGAIVGKALIAAKLGLAKKIALKGAALAAAPVVLAAGAKAKLAGIGLGLLAKKAIGVGALATSAGASLKAVSTKLSQFPSTVLNSVKMPTIAMPTLPSLPVAAASSKKGPTSIEYSLVVNGPHTGYKAKKGTIVHERRRREAEPEPQPQNQASAAQLLQLVKSQNAQQCLQKVICELSANPNAHGNDGIRFGRSLIALETQTDAASARQYRQAATTGARLQNAGQCKQHFPQCAFQSAEIVRIGNQMIAGSG